MLSNFQRKPLAAQEILLYPIHSRIRKRRKTLDTTHVREVHSDAFYSHFLK
jgi:hypothetical protein